MIGQYGAPVFTEGPEFKTQSFPEERWVLLQVKSPMTMTEKILAKHADRARVAPGENIWTNVDKLLTHDVCGPGTFGIFQKEFGENAQVRAQRRTVCMRARLPHKQMIGSGLAQPSATHQYPEKPHAAPTSKASGSMRLDTGHLFAVTGCLRGMLACWVLHGTVCRLLLLALALSLSVCCCRHIGVGSGGRDHHPGPLHLHLRPAGQPQRRHPQVLITLTIRFAVPGSSRTACPPWWPYLLTPWWPYSCSAVLTQS